MSDEGGPDLGKLLAQAQEMMQAQAEAAEQVVEGVAGGGAVKITVSGGGEFQSVTISPEAVDPDDVEMLQDLVLAALHDATGKVQQLQQGALGALGGLDLGGLGFGGALGSGQ